MITEGARSVSNANTGPGSMCSCVRAEREKGREREGGRGGWQGTFSDDEVVVICKERTVLAPLAGVDFAVYCKQPARWLHLRDGQLQGLICGGLSNADVCCPSG